MKKYLPALTALAALTAAFSSSHVLAQELAVESDSALVLEEVIITATRMETTLSDTPVAVTAFAGDDLARSGVTDVFGITDSVPNLSVDRIDGGLNVTIRGVTSSDNTEKGDPSVNFMLDDVVIARPQAQGVSFYDVERVEVLRGPQGTLFGRNTTGGAINVITAKPDLTGFSAKIDGGLGNYSARNMTAAVNVPVSETFGLRAAVNLDQRDNYLDGGPLTQGKIDEFKDNTSFRLTGLYQWDSGEVSLQYDKSKMKGQRGNFLPVETFYDVVDANGNFSVTPKVDPRRFAVDGSDALKVNYAIAFDPSLDDETDGFRLAFEQSVGPVDLHYIGSSRNFKSDVVEARPLVNSPVTYLYAFGGDFDQDSHEIRLSSNGDGPLTWQIGYLNFKERSDNYLKINFDPSGDPDCDTCFGYGFFQGPTKSDSEGYFGQATYDLSDALRLTVGGRYTKDEKSQVGYIIPNFYPGGYGDLEVPTDGRPYNNNLAASWDETTWKVGLDYDLTDDTMVYANISKGYKAGGINGGCEANAPATECVGTSLGELAYYDPETIISYEAGAKGLLLGGALRLDAVAFYYDYTDLQVTGIEEILPGQTGSVTRNAAKAGILGFEFSSQYLASENDLIDLALTLLDTEYKDFDLGIGGGASYERVDLSGNSLQKTPEWTVSLGYTHTFPLANGATIDAGIKSKISDSYQMLNTVFANFWEQPGYSKTDLNLTYNSADDRWYISAFAKNLENSIVVTTVNATGSARRYVQTQAPRTVGLQFGYVF